MLQNLKLFLLLGLSLTFSPIYSTELSKKKKHDITSTSVEEIAEEMNSLNNSLDLLSVTVSKILP